MTTAAEFADKVLAGASFLDLAEPGWAERINLGTLDLGDSRRCVIGQTMGRYIPGIEKLGLTKDQSVALGYNTATSGDYEALTAAWRPLIEERQPQVPVQRTVPNGIISYVVTPHSNALEIARYESGRETRSFELGTQNRSVWRGVAQAIIEMADEA